MTTSAKRVFRAIMIVMFSLIMIEVICVWWEYHRAIVVIVNDSGKEISDLKIKMREGVRDIGTLSIGEKKHVRVFPQGESHFSILFMTPEKKLMYVPGGYIESTGGYRFVMTIAPNWSVSKKLTLSRGCIIFSIYDYFHSR